MGRHPSLALRALMEGRILVLWAAEGSGGGAGAVEAGGELGEVGTVDVEVVVEVEGGGVGGRVN